jgi:DNA polymerase-4
MTPIILHLDMNSYFASVLQQDNRAYRGKPLGVCEHLGGIIISASIEAKKWGIKTGTPVWEAKKLYPKIILTHTTAERFRFYTRRLVKLVSEYTDQVELYSIDEVFMDITRVANIENPKSEILKLNSPTFGTPSLAKEGGGGVNPFLEAVRIALEIKQRMKQEVGDYLTCSIGIAENKVLAKIGSDLKKPDGIVVIQNSKSEILNPKQILNSKSQILNLKKDELYHQLKLTDVPGIGERQEKNLNALGIKTLLDLKNYPKSHLIARFGRITGHHLHNLGQLNASWKTLVHRTEDIHPHTKTSKLSPLDFGYQSSNKSKVFRSEINFGVGVKSIGHMYTLPKEYRKPEFFEPVLFKLCEMVAKRLRRKNLEGNVINAFCYFGDHQSCGNSVKVGEFVCDGREIFSFAKAILNTSVADKNYVKMIGVTVGKLQLKSGQLSLFGHREESQSLLLALDKINNKYGEFTVARAPVLGTGKVFRDSVGFGRVKEL